MAGILPRNESDPLIRTPSSVGSFSDRPLFGDQQSGRDRVLNYGLILACAVLIVVTLFTLILVKFNLTNLLALLVIMSFSGSHGLVIHWYRLGDLDPKFRNLLFWNSVNLCLLCVIALAYYLEKKG
ncbi:putative transmembrane protein [Halotydeus destructor]|nr:putative transmembrane protein [Halotydeus destructor]